jgi:predicted PurR-regulated permease PerM
MLTQYIRAQLFLCVLSFVFYSAAMLVLRFPHAIVLGILGGLLEFIPVLGWTSTFAAVVGVGMLNHSHWVRMAALLGIWRVIQDYFATPRIMGSHLKIHPLAAIFGVLVGAEIGGIVGIYLAVPMMASFGIIWRSVAQKRTKQGGRPKQSVATGRPLEEGPELLVISCHRRPPVRVSLLLPLVHAATTLLVRRVLTSRMGGWPKKRLYSRLNWLTLS